jgi:Ankyrin repeat
MDETERAISELAKADIYAAISEAATNILRRPTADGLEHPEDVQHIRNLLQKEPGQAKRWDFEITVGCGSLITFGTPLHLAVQSVLPKVAEVLLEYGADPNAFSDEQPEAPIQQLYDALEQIHGESEGEPQEDARYARLVEVLARHGADLTQPVRVASGMSPLPWLTMGGFLGVASVLRDHGVAEISEIPKKKGRRRTNG